MRDEYQRTRSRFSDAFIDEQFGKAALAFRVHVRPNRAIIRQETLEWATQAVDTMFRIFPEIGERFERVSELYFRLDRVALYRNI